jgi:hypothetical protein
MTSNPSRCPVFLLCSTPEGSVDNTISMLMLSVYTKVRRKLNLWGNGAWAVKTVA